MDELLRHVVPLALGAAVSPAVLTFAVLTLTARVRPIARGVAFTLGVLVVLTLLTVVGLTVMSHVTDHPSGARRAVSDGVDVAIGLALLALAARSLLHRGADASPASPASPVADAKNVGLGRTFAVGMVLMATNITTIMLYIPAMKEIAKSPVSDTDKAIAVLVMIVIVSIPAWLPLLVRCIAPGPSTRVLSSLNDTIQRHRHGIVLGVELVFGVYLLAKGFRV